jgi:hypothetical protein
VGKEFSLLFRLVSDSYQQDGGEPERFLWKKRGEKFEGFSIKEIAEDVEKKKTNY